MPKDPEAILIEYRDADADLRLHMFLDYRELRDQFRTIDFSETGDQVTVNMASSRSAGIVGYMIKCFVSAFTGFMRFPDFDITALEHNKKTVLLQEKKDRRHRQRTLL